MRELLAAQNIFDITPANPRKTMVCVTTNGMTRYNGNAIMGKGIALEAKKRFPDLERRLGKQLRSMGNHTYHMGQYPNYDIATLPTKYDWRDKSDINLIKQSARELVDLCNALGIKECYLSRVGCGNGGLNWTHVKKELEPILDDRFIIVSNN